MIDIIDLIDKAMTDIFTVTRRQHASGITRQQPFV